MKIRFTRSRKIAAVIFVAITAGVIVCGLTPYAYWMVGRVGHPEYCEHFVTEDRGVRVSFTPISMQKEIDPNNWQNEQFAHDFLTHLVIIVPYIDYEITQDRGVSWENFGRYESPINEYAWCDNFDSLDADHFWIWMRGWAAVTHDGGQTFFIHDIYKELGYMTIDYVKFDTPDSGRIVFLFSDPTLLTDDGGKTWYVDPNWTVPKD